MKIPGLAIENSALLVIDVINSCAHPDYEESARDIHYSRIRKMIPSLSSFITSYRRLGGRVILTTTVPWQEPYLPGNINELYRNSPQARYWSQDTSGRAEQFFQIPTEGALVVVKNSYDAFTSDALLQSLEEMHSKYILVAGVFGDGCVMASICGGFSKGYSLIMARDLIETTDDDDRQKLQDHLKRRTWPLMYGPTLDSQEILEEFSKGTPQGGNSFPAS